MSFGLFRCKLKLHPWEVGYPPRIFEMMNHVTQGHYKKILKAIRYREEQSLLAMKELYQVLGIR